MKNQWITLLMATLPLSIGTGTASAEDTTKIATPNPVEVGNVNWQRNYPTALADAKKSDKPIFALFQEVPG